MVSARRACRDGNKRSEPNIEQRKPTARKRQKKPTRGTTTNCDNQNLAAHTGYQTELNNARCDDETCLKLASYAAWQMGLEILMNKTKSVCKKSITRVRGNGNIHFDRQYHEKVRGTAIHVAKTMT